MQPPPLRTSESTSAESVNSPSLSDRPQSARRKPNLRLTVPQPDSPPIRQLKSPGSQHEPVTPPASAELFGSPRAKGSVTPTSTPVTPMSMPKPDNASSPFLDSGSPISPTCANASAASPSRRLERKLTPDMLLSPIAPILSPMPVAIDMPSPSFDPLLEHFLRPLDPQTMCACILERTARGKMFRMLVEDGNVLLLVGEVCCSVKHRGYARLTLPCCCVASNAHV